MIQICDSIMGSGKTQSVITHINENPGKRFIYITPYLDEATRIKESCPDARFVEPSNRITEYHFSKREHLEALMSEGRNIASTHKLFLNFRGKILEYAASGHYELIIDEAVETIQHCKISPGDYDHIKRSGWILDDGTRNVDCDDDYSGERFKDIFALIKNGNMIEADRKGEMYYWMMTPEVFGAFENIKVLTYLFDAQILKYYFDLNGVAYERIAIEHPDEHTYRFTDGDGYIPDYVGTLGSKIHIFDNDKLNSVGDNYYALSCTWFDRKRRSDRSQIDKIRKNVQNYFRNYMSTHRENERLWSVWTDYESSIEGKGYKNKCLAFNSKATNDYRDRRVLAYCTNVFMNPFAKNYLLSRGVNVLEEEYALSIMIQWIWRSAIRDGDEIWIYIPSERMRSLLLNWIKGVEARYEAYRKEREATHT